MMDTERREAEVNTATSQPSSLQSIKSDEEKEKQQKLVTIILTEVVPFCKSGHIYLHNVTVSEQIAWKLMMDTEGREAELNTATSQPSSLQSIKSDEEKEKQQKLNKRLCEFARDGDLENLKKALKFGADVKALSRIAVVKDVHGPLYGDTTPYSIAHINDHQEVVKFLEDKGLTVNYNHILLTAAAMGQLDIVKQSIDKSADVNFQNEKMFTALHYATLNGHSETVQLLLQRSADPNICSEGQWTALHIASIKGHFVIAKSLLNSKADSNICNEWEKTALHLAYWEGHHNIVELFCTLGTEKMDKVKKDYLLLTAAENGDMQNVNVTLSDGANVNVHHQDIRKHQRTALHLASMKGWSDVVELLLNSKADPNICDMDQRTAMHLASDNGHSNVVKLLLHHKAEHNIRDEVGRTPVHWAAERGYVETLKLLIEEGHVDVNAKDKDGNSLLHLACRSCSEETIQYLLHNVQLDPAATNNHQQMPIDCIPPFHDIKSRRFQLLKLFQSFPQYHVHGYLTESYVKIFLCGKSGAGKSSLAGMISYRAQMGEHHRYDPMEEVKDIVLQTTGIDYHSIRSWEIGNVVIFDFAGHAEYYSSHAAVLETLLLRSPVVFVIVSKLTDEEETIQNDLCFWFNFIENVTKNLSSSSPVLILGSHVDCMLSQKDFQPFMKKVVSEAINFQTYEGFLAIDCHRLGGKDVKKFMRKLKETCEAAVDKNDKISYHCHCLNAFLQQLEVVAISIDALCTKLNEKNEPCLLSDKPTVLEFLTILGDKGLILRLGDWLIIDQKALLTEVNGVLFNKNIDKVCKPVASNTGIMPVSTLLKLFPKHNADMLIQFLTSLQFCQQIDSRAVRSITNNVLSEEWTLNKDEKFLFFPALITEDKPSSLFNATDGFGWCLWCPNPQQFLSTRFLHTLLLHLAYTQCLSPDQTGFIATNSKVQALQRVCSMWKNGISWKDENNIEIMVEVTEHNRCVTILVSNSHLIESYQIRTLLIREVINLKNELCQCKTEQFVIAPGNVRNVIDKEMRHRTLCSLKDVARGVLVKGLVRYTNSTSDERRDVQSVVGEKEPYYCIDPLVTKSLFSDSKKDTPLPSQYIQHVKEMCREIMTWYLPSSDSTHLSIRKHLNQFSIFAGRNPFSASYRPIKDEEIYRVSKHVLHTIKKETFSGKPTRLEVLTHLASIDHLWRSVGNGLGVSYNVLQGLADSSMSNQTRLDHVIQTWLDMDGHGEGVPVAWSAIIDVIKGPLVQHKNLAKKICQYLQQENDEGQIAQNNFNPSNVFKDHSAELCDAIESNLFRFVNKLVDAKLMSSDVKKNMSGDAYEKADHLVNVQLQKQVDEKGIDFLRKICAVLLKHTDRTWKDIGQKMMSQLEIVGGQHT